MIVAAIDVLRASSIATDDGRWSSCVPSKGLREKHGSASSSSSSSSSSCSSCRQKDGMKSERDESKEGVALSSSFLNLNLFCCMHWLGNPFHESGGPVCQNDPPVNSIDGGLFRNCFTSCPNLNGSIDEDSKATGDTVTDDSNDNNHDAGGGGGGGDPRLADPLSLSAQEVREELCVQDAENRLFGSALCITSGALNGFTRSVGRYMQVSSSTSGWLFSIHDYCASVGLSLFAVGHLI